LTLGASFEISATALASGAPAVYDDGMTETDKSALLERYSRNDISAVELRRALGGVTFGDVLIELAKRDLPLPRAPAAGREESIAQARAWLFPRTK
jgi:hypothetical protein